MLQISHFLSNFQPLRCLLSEIIITKYCLTNSSSKCFYTYLLAFCVEMLFHLLHPFIHSFYLQVNGFGDSHFTQGYNLLLLFILLPNLYQI